MKKVRNTVIAVGIVSIAILTGCQNIIEHTTQETELTENDFSTVTGKIAFIQTTEMKKALSAIENYIDIPKETMRSGEKTIEDIASYLPDDLSTLKRKKDLKSRNSIENDEITLYEELQTIINDYKVNIASIIPDPTPASNLEYVNIEDGLLYMEDDRAISLESPQGMMTIEVLNRISQGEDIDDIISSIENDLSLLDSKEPASRGLYKLNTPLWKDGIVYYRFGKEDDHKKNIKQHEMSAHHKEKILWCMNEWSSKTDGAVQFVEMKETGWNKFLVAMAMKYVVSFYDYDFEQKGNGITLGNSQVGENNSSNYSYALQILRGLEDEKFPDTEICLGENRLQGTMLHELGHVIGLEHEHCRSDRDMYVITDEEGINYNKIPDEIFKLQWLTKRVKVMWWYQNIYYLGYSPVANAWKTTNFDFYSIMLYEGTLVNTNYYFVHKYPYPSVQLNYELSTKDIETVKRMYR